MSVRSLSGRGAMAVACLSAAVFSGCASGSGGPTRLGARASAPACADSTFPIYFKTNADQLTPESLQVINQAAEGVKGCAFGPLDVVGLAGSLEGPPEQAMALARRRSIAVAEAVKAAGLPAPRFDLDAVGKEGAQTKGGRHVPLRRRAEVVIHAGNPTTASTR